MTLAHSVRERYWTPQEEYWRSLSHAQFQTLVLKRATKAGWELIFHAHDSRRTIGKGFPDLVLAKSFLVLFIELKTEFDQESEDQIKWLNTISDAADVNLWVPGARRNLEARTWRPSDEYEIMEVLNRAA